MDIIKITGAAVVLMSSFMLGMYFVVVNKMRIKNLADIAETYRQKSDFSREVSLRYLKDLHRMNIHLA